MGEEVMRLAGPVITRVQLSDQVAEVITDMLFTGEFKPGDRVIEADLAKQLGTSRTPVREALLRLHQQGLVVRTSGHGTTIREWTRQDIEELYQVRALLEGHVVRIVTANRNALDFSGLQAIVREMWQTARRRSVRGLLRLDIEFHTEMCRLTGQHLLIKVLGDLSLRTRFFMALNAHIHPSLDEIAEIHQIVLNAIVTKSVDEAEGVIRLHLRSAVERMSAICEAAQGALQAGDRLRDRGEAAR